MFVIVYYTEPLCDSASGADESQMTLFPASPPPPPLLMYALLSSFLLGIISVIFNFIIYSSDITVMI